MRIYKVLVDPEDHIGAFDAQIEFRLDEDDDIDLIGYWLSHTFSKHFVLLEHSERIYAGGCTDNAEGWDKEWNSRGVPEPYQCYYKLRMMNEDRTIFTLKYGNDIKKDNE